MASAASVNSSAQWRQWVLGTLLPVPATAIRLGVSATNTTGSVGASRPLGSLVSLQRELGTDYGTTGLLAGAGWGPLFAPRYDSGDAGAVGSADFGAGEIVASEDKLPPTLVNRFG